MDHGVDPGGRELIGEYSSVLDMNPYTHGLNIARIVYSSRKKADYPSWTVGMSHQPFRRGCGYQADQSCLPIRLTSSCQVGRDDGESGYAERVDREYHPRIVARGGDQTIVYSSYTMRWSGSKRMTRLLFEGLATCQSDTPRSYRSSTQYTKPTDQSRSSTSTLISIPGTQRDTMAQYRSKLEATTIVFLARIREWVHQEECVDPCWDTDRVHGKLINLIGRAR